MLDTGWYSCRISNQYGKLFRSGYVQVVELTPEASLSYYTYLSIGIGGTVGLCLCCVGGVQNVPKVQEGERTEDDGYQDSPVRGEVD